MLRPIVLILALAFAFAIPTRGAGATSCPNRGVPGTPYEGFGSTTTGGAGQPTYRVTTLADTGPGSLRDALSTGRRCIVFDVAGEIVLRSQVYIRGDSLTVDGFSAQAPGITVRDYGISVWGTHGAQNIVLRGLRFRNAGQSTCRGATDHAEGHCWDAIQIKNGASRVVIDHVSVHNASDGAVDITSQVGTLTRDVTVQWSILSGTKKQVGIGRAIRVSIHHNLLADGQTRNPEAGWDRSLASAPPDTVLDLRNNVIWNFSAYGTLVRRRGTANVVSNFYYSPQQPTSDRALVVSHQGRAHAVGNHSATGADVDGRGTELSPFPAPAIATTDACRALAEVREGAGARGPRFGLDAIDRGYIAALAAATELPGCTDGRPAQPLSTRHQP
jgi:hypothetical protein